MHYTLLGLHFDRISLVATLGRLAIILARAGGTFDAAARFFELASTEGDEGPEQEDEDEKNTECRKQSQHNRYIVREFVVRIN